MKCLHTCKVEDRLALAPNFRQVVSGTRPNSEANQGSDLSLAATHAFLHGVTAFRSNPAHLAQKP